MSENTFTTLYQINVNDKTEAKNGLTYLSWAFAWAEFKKVCPNATYEVLKFDGKPYIYDENLGYMCYTTVTVDGLTHEMWLPVMDGANKAMKAYAYKYTDRFGKEKTVNAANMFDINKTIMRCLTKNLAMFGLGLYIYGGEDLPEESKITDKEVLILKNLCKRKGLDVNKTFPNGIENLTPTQYAESVKQLEKVKEKATENLVNENEALNG